jgi:hypothetical protein
VSEMAVTNSVGSQVQTVSHREHSKAHFATFDHFVVVAGVLVGMLGLISPTASPRSTLPQANQCPDPFSVLCRTPR